MKIINMIIAEASIETIPPEISNHPAIMKTSRRRGKHWSEMLLDISLHYSAMKKLPDRYKRGRPDITHITLLEMLSSPLNIEGYLRVYVHTVNDYVMFIDPRTRIPKNYNRFVGLIEQLFKYGQVPPETPNPLITLSNLNFRNLLTKLGVDKVITLDEGGELRSCDDICSTALREGLPIVVGGFPHGDFREEIYDSSKYIFSIYKQPLETWVVVSRVLSSCERILGVL